MEDRRVIAMGFFDGVHIGHKALLDMTKKRAQELNAMPAVISFDTHPEHTVTGNMVPLLNTPNDRADIIRRYYGIKDVIFLHFDEDLMRMPWGMFIDWMKNGFGACALVAGFDFSFGYMGEGNSQLLRERCRKIGIGCDVISRVSVDNVKVSSSYIRTLIVAGKMAEAVKLLGHPHVLTEIVRDGYRFGRKLGVPTINMRIPEGVLCPKRGVYAAKVHLPEEGDFLAVTNVGVRPTVGGKDVVSVESHILDYSGDLYGKMVRVEFYEYLREEVKFADAVLLKAQIDKDIARNRDFFGNMK